MAVGSKSFCGIDFGTSNSILGMFEGNQPTLLPLENSKKVIPSTIFFDFEDQEILYGREAIERYIEGTEGRFMRALKSILGSSLIDETTRVGRKSLSFQDIIGLYIGELKARAEQTIGTELTEVVAGRPIYFVDDNPKADQKAQDTLEAIYKSQGFKDITFQYEPVAAALDYEQSATEEELALIIDIGGGTSDFSVVRVSPDGASKQDRSDDILSNLGVHIGGTDFDRLLSLARIMPLLGLHSKVDTTFRDGVLDMPTAMYHDLATWHSINFLYNDKTIRTLKELKQRAHQPNMLDRFINVINLRLGHKLAFEVESAKIDVSEKGLGKVDLSLIEDNLGAEINTDELITIIKDSVTKVANTLREAIKTAGVTPEDIKVVFLTGGSTAIPYLRETLLSEVKQAKLVEGDLFGSVGTGLALEAKRVFG